MVGRLLTSLLAAALVGGLTTPVLAQSVVFHLHNEASATAGLRQLRTAGPDGAQAVVQTAALQGVAVGEKKIIEFDTVAGVPNSAGKIPSGATVTATVWMRKTAALGTMFPRVKVGLNTGAGTALCTATGTTALTTTLSAYTLTCATTANITLVAADRFYVWTGVNLTVASSAGAFRGELGVEGTLNGSADSRVDIPTALPAPAIGTLTPNAGPIGATVTIAGNNFRVQQLSSVVKFFNNRTATVTSWSNTSIVATVPASSATGAVTVTVAGTASAGVTFTVGTVPTIAQLAPNVGLPATAVTITGTSFGATKGTSTIKFNAVTATTTAWNATTITATVPVGATTGPVVVTVGGLASAGVTFTVPTLNSIAVSPGVLTVPVGGQQQYKALGFYSDNLTRNVTASAVWASTDGAVVTTAPGGLATVTGISGTATISATLGTASGANDITATPSKFRPVGSLKTARTYHTATPLPNGKVLIAGGQDSTFKITNTAELYDPATGRFTPTAAMVKKRHLHTATLLLDGTVLITGGLSYSPDEYHSSAEIYDPASGTFTPVFSMSMTRFYHSATRMSDGRVLIEQGNGAFGQPPVPSEIYDPVTHAFTVTGSPTTKRSEHTATLLADGRVLVTGGNDENGYPMATTEIYDPVSGAYTVGSPLTTARRGHTATRLPDARLLVIGGYDPCPAACSAEVFTPATQAFTPVAPLSVARGVHTATVLNSGLVLVVAGSSASTTATAELFDPAANTFVAAGALAAARAGHTATLLQDGSLLIAGGSGPLARGGELYAPAAIVPLSLTVTPTTATLQLGESRGFTAVDHLGHPRSDAQWSGSNSSVATVDSSTGVVTAAAAGAITLTASISGVSGVAQITVTVGPPPPGTPLWTVAPAAGATSHRLVPVNGGGTGGPALVSVSTTATETELEGLTPDGQQQWRTWLPGPARQVVPNASGGVLLTVFDGCDGVNPLQLINIDGPTGIWGWQAAAASVCNHDLPQIAIRHDGAVAVATPGNIAGFPNLMMLNGDTGAALSVPTIPQSTFTSFSGQQVPGYSRIGPTMVDADGTTHMLYEKRFLAYPPQIVNTGIWLMSVRADQTYTTTQLNTSTQNVNLFPGRIIPDGTGGLIASWIDSPIVQAGLPPAQSTFRAARVISGGGVIPFDLPVTPALELLHPATSPLPTNPELVLGQNTWAYVGYGNTVGGFIATNGAGGWSYSSANEITMLAAGADTSLVAKTAAPDGTDTILRFYAGGGLATSSFGLANIGHMVKDLWTVSSAAGGSAVIKGESIDWATTGWFQVSPAGQRRVSGVYRDLPGVPGHQSAAFDMMNALRPLATRWEWGGLICKSGLNYSWTRFVTSQDSGTVDVMGQVDCGGQTTAAAIHLHVLGAGLPTPSGPDLQNANNFTSFTYYLSAPKLDQTAGSQFIRYQGPNAVSNTCYWFGTWKKYGVSTGWLPCTP